MADREFFFVTCAPGLEPLLHAEARELKLSKVERQVGGIQFEGTLADAMRANLWMRTAVRVLLRVARFDASDDKLLYAGASAVDWNRFLTSDGSFAIDAHTNASVLDHTLFIEQRVKDAIVDGFRSREGKRPNVDKDDPDLSVHVHLVKNRATLLVDTSGESLHKRGWRRYQGRAPISETLAAALVLYSGWDLRAPLIDPFCGGGTILIEAALIARNIAPGFKRERFSFQRWPGYDAAAWKALVSAAQRAAKPKLRLNLHGSDWDPATIAGANENLAGAGLEGEIEFNLAEATEWEPRKGWNAWIVTNPPYGERVGAERGLEESYRRFGEFLRTRCSGYTLALLTSNPRLAEALALKDAERRALLNGPLECVLLTARL
ncbi:MAG TPA: THUMP domain-containing protein [Planctomycetota bacterium]|nr:THUMP domain-containing protein [Planctomycetota bacterium]